MIFTLGGQVNPENSAPESKFFMAPSGKKSLPDPTPADVRHGPVMADPTMLPPTVKHLELVALSLLRGPNGGNRRREAVTAADIETWMTPPVVRGLRLVASNPEVEPAAPIIPAPVSLSIVRRPLELSLVPEPEVFNLPVAARRTDLALVPRVAVFQLPLAVGSPTLALASAIEIYNLPVAWRPAALFRTPVIVLFNLAPAERRSTLSLAQVIDIFALPPMLRGPDLSRSPRMDVYPCPPSIQVMDLSLAPAVELFTAPLFVDGRPDISMLPPAPVAETMPINLRRPDLSPTPDSSVFSVGVQPPPPELSLAEPPDTGVPLLTGTFGPDMEGAGADREEAVSVLLKSDRPIALDMSNTPQKPPQRPETATDVLELRESDILPTPGEGESPEEIGRGPSGDKERAERLGKALTELQEAMDAAIMAGLVVEPEFTTLSNRFSAMGVTSDSYLLKVEVYRKLV